MKNNLARNDQQKYIPIVSLIGIIGILIVAIYNSAFKGGRFTCNRYILNSYLYILLVLVLIMLEVLYLDYEKFNSVNIFKHFSGLWGTIGMLVILVGVLLILMKIHPKFVILKHLVWIIFSLILGILVYPFYQKSKAENTLVGVMFSLISILIVFSAVAFIKPEWISLSWGPILCFILLGVIIFSIINRLINKDNKKYQRPKWLSYFVIVLFIFFLLYDTKVIQVHAKNCKTETADYINESLGIVLDVLNLFQNLVRVQGS
jgi:hypothetical protein